MACGVLVCGFLACATWLPAEEGASWLAPGRLTLGGRAGEDVQEYVADALVPIWKPGRAIVFLNPRGTFLEDDEQELNVGLVARRLSWKQRVILGANAYYDTRWTESGNQFEQVGGGIEILSRWVALRANYYYPLTDEKVEREIVEVTRTRSGSRRTATTTLFRTYEEALEGYDAEIGVWVPYLSRHVPTALYVGWYDFSSDVESYDTDGLKVRLESRLHPNLTLDAEWFDDKELNRSEYFVGLRLRLPLDFWRGLKLERGGESSGSGGPALDARMSDMVYRDFRIRTRQTGRIAVSQDMLETTVDRPDDAPPPKNCYQYADLDSDGNVVIITVCE